MDKATYDALKTGEVSKVLHIGSVERAGTPACCLIPGVGCSLTAVIRISSHAAMTKVTVIQLEVYFPSSLVFLALSTSV